MTSHNYEQYSLSNTKWEEKIPSHWQVKRLRFVAEVLSSNVDKKTIIDETPVKLCNYTDVYYHDHITSEIDFMQATATDNEIDKFRLQSNDVVITKDSETPDDIGVPTLIVEDIEKLICGYHLAIIKAIPNVSYGPYLFYFFKSVFCSSQLEVAAKGVTRFGLSLEAIKSLSITLPPVEEQKLIVQYLNSKMSQIDKLGLLIGAGSKEKDISHHSLSGLLIEYRSALITNAVIGKIKVV